MKSTNNNHKKAKCEICKKEFLYSKLFPIKLIQNSVMESLLKKHPEMDRNGFVCYSDLREIRTEYVEKLLRDDKGALSQLDQDVLESMQSQDILSENVNKKFDRKLTFGERLSDKVSKFGGSWKFIISFLLVIVLWMVLNAFILLQGVFDPYPFILLNLFLSCLAALQAPIILMSQNRQSEKERLRANEDYCINLKAELEIQQLHSKLDLFMKRQWETLIELQKIQIDLTDDLLRHKKK
ncbi:MAG: hypothetical protein K1060chlam2_00713 [Chlamydiae bacterium]|nr:hypothetical protein [Chlamydiota bacterium]